MKIGLAIAPKNASIKSFVVYRNDFEIGIKKASELGYDGVELALAKPDEVDIIKIDKLIAKYRLTIPVLSTGRVFAEEKLWFTHSSQEVRNNAIQRVKDIVAIAHQFNANVNIGRVRGDIPAHEEKTRVKERFFSAIRECAEFAATKDVELLLEPVNRYETNFINSVEEAVTVVNEIGRKNVKLMPDVFHMNIEDASIENSLRQAGERISYVHFADSNRKAPGQGHIDFKAVIGVLREIGYEGFVTIEILPEKDPDEEAKSAIEFLRQFIN